MSNNNSFTETASAGADAGRNSGGLGAGASRWRSGTVLPAHLNYRQKTNLGSFYTPLHIVRLLYKTLAENAPADFADVVLEPACGFGVFFAESFPQQGGAVRFIGADIDTDALAVARRDFSKVSFFAHNALVNVNREKYGIARDERLVIVGNPPYNDVTSHVKNKIKSTPCKIDNDIRTRDLGLSFMLASAKLRPDYIAVLHPLSYLIKKANFRILAPLMGNYRLCDAVVFNSQEFAETSKGCGFPLVAAVYTRDAFGTDYEQICARKFHTLEGAIFSLSDYDYVCRYMPKYPERFWSGTPPKDSLKFFTMRDINALKRSRTFITEDTPNTIYIRPEKLHYYCYVDAFKEIAGSLPYYLGNLDVMIDRDAFEKIKDDFLTLSIAKHPAVFRATYPMPSSEQLRFAKSRVAAYFKELFSNIPFFNPQNLCP